MAPRREVGNGISLVRYGVPELDSLGHLSLSDTGVGVVACVETSGRRVMVSEHYYTRVEGQVFFRDLLAP